MSESETMRAALETVRVDMRLMHMSLMAGDPPSEIRVRCADIDRRIAAILSAPPDTSALDRAYAAVKRRRDTVRPESLIWTGLETALEELRRLGAKEKS